MKLAPVRIAASLSTVFLFAACAAQPPKK